MKTPSQAVINEIIAVMAITASKSIQAGLCPIHIAVTGHRDILVEDWPSLKEEVHHHLQVLQKTYPNCPFRILSGLAEGADQLVVQVAYEIGIPVIAVLPMPQVEYEKDFITPASLHEFRQLLAQTSGIVNICANPPSKEYERSNSYAALGSYLVQHSQILITLWDGIGLGDGETAKPGGTADVVAMSLGLKETLSQHESLQSLQNLSTSCQLIHIPCRRRSGLSTQNESEASVQSIVANLPISLLQTEYAQLIAARQKSVALVLKQFEDFNKAASKLNPEAVNKNLLKDDADWTGKRPPMVAAYAVADALARDRQALRGRYIRGLSVLAFMAIAFHQLYAGPDARLQWLILNIVLAIICYAIYKRVFQAPSQQEKEFFLWRAMAEIIRIQVFRELAGLSGLIVNEHQATRPAELDWVASALFNWKVDQDIQPLHAHLIINEAPQCTLADRLHLVKKLWVAGQETYFGKIDTSLQGGGAGASVRQHKLATQIGLRQKWLFFAGLFFTVITLIAEIFNWHPILHWVLFTSELLFIGSASLAAYTVQMGYEEFAKQYDRMGRVFAQGRKELDMSLSNQKYDSAQRTIHNLGRQSLYENSTWVQLHLLNAYEIEVT